MKKACLRNITLHASTRLFDLNLPEKNLSDALICGSGSPKMIQLEEMMLKIRQYCQNHYPSR